jgi:hypothetical protein
MTTPVYAEGSREPVLAVVYGALLLAWAALLFGGFVLGRPGATRAQRMPRWTRLASSFVLVLIGWTLTFFSDEQGLDFRFMLALGMTLGFAGDLLMAGAWRGRRSVIGGMIVFGLGHLAYIDAFWELIGRTGKPVIVWPVVLAWAVTVACWWAVVYRPAAMRTRLHWLALPYALLLASTLGLAMSAALVVQQAGVWIQAAGAALFLLSDLLLAADLFNEAELPRLAIGDAVWLLYGPAQAMIVFGSAWVLTS